MQGGDAVVFLGGEAFDVVGIGDEARGDADFLGLQPQQRLEQIDGGGGGLTPAALRRRFVAVGSGGGLSQFDRLHQPLAEA